MVMILKSTKMHSQLPLRRHAYAMHTLLTRCRKKDFINFYILQHMPKKFNYYMYNCTRDSRDLPFSKV